MRYYKLADIPENQGLASRIIEGITIFADRWISSEVPLDFKAFGFLVIESVEKASPNAIVLSELPPLKIEEPKPVVEIPTKKTTKDVLIERGFSEKELKGRPDEELRELLDFDSKIYRRR